MSNEINKNHMMVCTPVHSDVSIHYESFLVQKECITNKQKLHFN